jgi:two-component system phosphate regulon sensor histidine kinase PhoR
LRIVDSKRRISRVGKTIENLCRKSPFTIKNVKIKTRYKKTKNLNPKFISAINAVGIAVILTLVFYIGNALQLSLLTVVVIAILSTLIISFLTTYYWIDTFIYHKIKLIYKIILDYKMSKDTKKEWRKKYRSIEMAEQEAISYVTKKDIEMKHLREMEAFRKDFLGSVSHELKTPLTSIQGYVLTLLDGGLYDEKINYQYLYKASKNIDRIIAIVNDLDTITKLEYKDFKLNIEKIDLKKLLQDSLDMLEMLSKQHNVRYEVNANVERSYMVYADRESIQNVFLNLITNAIKYNDKEEKKIKITFFDMDQNYLIEITDNGIGIESRHLPRLFERFYRISKDRSREMGGSGLGLAIVKHIIEAHKQSIYVRSTPGVGSTFSFTLKKSN